MTTALTYTTPDRLIQDFASRGLVVLAPESLGVPPEIHGRIFDEQKRAHDAGERVSPAEFPDVLDIINSPGVVAACNQLVGENWAIAPFTHNASFPSRGRDQHWHKDDNGPYNSRKQRHHQAVQIEMLYYPQEVRADMGPTATIPYSHYWAFNHEENHDNFAGADHLDFHYHLSGMETEPSSGPECNYDFEDIVNQRTSHDIRLREAVTNTGWPLVRQFEAAPLRAGTVLLYSHNTFHRGNHRRDDWRTWPDNPRFMWRFWIYRTTDPVAADEPHEIDWQSLDTDPLTGISLADVDDDLTSVWRYHDYWIRTARTPPPYSQTITLSPGKRRKEAGHLFERIHAKGEEAEPVRIGAAYRLASIGDTSIATEYLGRALYTERESVRRAATYGLVAVGPDATDTFLEATSAPTKWVRKAGVYGLGDASHLSDEVLRAVSECLCDDISVYVRSVAAGTLGCLGRRAVATGIGELLIPACFDALVQSLGREENRLAMDRAQGRGLKLTRPTDESDVCEGSGIDFGHERFSFVRSAVRENALWSLVILSSHGASVAGHMLEPTITMLRHIIRCDENIISVGFAMDALNRLANLIPGDAPKIIGELHSKLPSILGESPEHAWESLVRGGLRHSAAIG